MKLILESKEFIYNLDKSLYNPLYTPIRKELAEPHDPKNILWDTLRLPLDNKLCNQLNIPIRNQLKNTPHMKLILKSKEFIRKLDVYLDIPLYYTIMNQLSKPLDPNLIIWDKLRLPLLIKLNNQKKTPIENKLNNTHI